jgi:DNA-binding NtrC family response regulator
MLVFPQRVIFMQYPIGSPSSLWSLAMMIAKVLSSIFHCEPIEIHFAESRVEAWDALNRLNSPLILYDRDWLDAEWRTTVQTFASSPHRSCVILASRVADDYLWQELIRCGGYDLLGKPFRADDVARALKLALSYWRSARAAAAQ